MEKRRREQHRMRRSPTYKGWEAMKARCQNPNNNRYPLYGARGVRVCERWQSFSNFFADMGERPPGMTLDRIDANGDYEPRNCRWATQRTQQNNRSNNIVLSIHGREQTAVNWWRELQSPVPLYTVYRRLRNGWSAADAMLSPAKRHAPR